MADKEENDNTMMIIIVMMFVMGGVGLWLYLRNSGDSEEEKALQKLKEQKQQKDQISEAMSRITSSMSGALKKGTRTTYI